MQLFVCVWGGLVGWLVLQIGIITYPGLQRARSELSSVLPYCLSLKQNILSAHKSANIGLPPAPNFNVIWRAD